jgi:uncharacterized protein (DUF169 family)
MSDVNYVDISNLLITKGKVRGKPVAISLFKDSVPPGYEPVDDTPCAIVRYAMDEGRRVYFDAEHHDCLVGMHHAGIIPGKKEIVTGAYLSETGDFFTTEGAARLKSSDAVLPPGLVRAIGAAPLDSVPEGVHVDWIVVVCNPHNANAIAGCRMCAEGVRADAVYGTSLCVELFATPWQKRNCLVASGDFGGRMHNRIKQDQVFVIIPIEHAHFLPAMLENIRVDVKASRRMTKPAHSSFWKKDAEGGVQDDGLSAEAVVDAPASGELFTMEWDKEARTMMAKVPEGILEMVVTNAEAYARTKNYAVVSRKSLQEQMAEMGMDIDEMLASV